MLVEPRSHGVVPPHGVLRVAVLPRLGAGLQDPRGVPVVAEEHLEEEHRRARGLPPHGPDDPLCPAQDPHHVGLRRVLQELVTVVHRDLDDQEVGPLADDPIVDHEGQGLAPGGPDGGGQVLHRDAAPLERLHQVRPVPRPLEGYRAPEHADPAAAPLQGLREGLEPARLEDQVAEAPLALEAVDHLGLAPWGDPLVLDVHVRGRDLHGAGRLALGQTVREQRDYAAHAGGTAQARPELAHDAKLRARPRRQPHKIANMDRR
mmetsp:Transcript_93053/g.263339  ORF Transcript_93053/g.263339 Transcript_93053/m.263339 type:complete len:262 (+) Transcript_93053:766-1551(+)